MIVALNLIKYGKNKIMVWCKKLAFAFTWSEMQEDTSCMT